jgi:hypothetical protein
LRARFIIFLLIFQSILLLAHWFIYSTWITLGAADPPAVTGLQIAVVLSSFSFVAASLLAFRITNPVVRAFYRVAALWLGAVNSVPRRVHLPDAFLRHHIGQNPS